MTNPKTELADKWTDQDPEKQTVYIYSPAWAGTGNRDWYFGSHPIRMVQYFIRKLQGYK